MSLLPSGEPAELDSLRRRLYRADASEADRERYRALLAAHPQPASPRTTPAGAPPAGRAPAIRTAVLLLAGVLAVGALVVGTTVRPDRPRPVPPTTTTAIVVPLAVPAPVRTAFVRDLERDRGAQLADYLLQHPQTRPAQLTTLRRAATEEHHGTGPDEVRLGPSALADRGGRMTVILTLGSDADAGWRAFRTAQRTDHSSYAQEVAERRIALVAGLPVSATDAYRGAAPDRLRIAAPADVRWDVVVVFSD